MQLTSYEVEFENLINKLASQPNGTKLLKLSGISEDMLDIAQYTNRFFNSKDSNVADLSTDPNSNIKQRSAITYVNEAPKPTFRLNSYHQLWQYLLESNGIERANEAVKADINGDIYIADFHLWNLPYCYAFSAMDILNNGMPFIPHPVSGPAVHLDSFIQHVIQSTMYYSNSIAGAVAFPDFFPALWFVYQYDKKIGYPTDDPVKFEKWVEQQFQLFTFTINQPYRSGTQSPFVNISVFDKGFLEDMFTGLSWYNPKTQEVVEIDLNGVDYLQKKYSEWFCRESKKQLFTFPVMTANILVEDENNRRTVVDKGFFEWVGEVTKDRALFNIYTGTRGNLSTCCRLRSDSNKMKQFFNSLGSGGTKIGSHRVCTINLPRLAHNSKDFDDFMDKLQYKMKLCHDILKAHRRTLQHEIDKGLLPLYSLGFMDLNTQFSTVGIIGFYEALDILGYDLTDLNNLPQAQKVIELMNRINDEASFADGFMYNLEQIPGESAAVKLAQKDELVYGMEYKMYSNQFLPLVKKVPLASRIKAQGAFDSKMSGGSVLHINLAEKIQSVDMLLTLMDYAVQAGCVYFAPNYNIQECENGHITVGKTGVCPDCGGKIVENYTRVVGFYTPVSDWKEERRGKVDYESRQWM